MKFPKNSPYLGTEKVQFKPNHQNTELLKKGKKADFQGQLIDSSIRFNMDKKASQLGYANKASAGGNEQDMVYNVKSDRVDDLNSRPWAEKADKESKNHLTQMKTLNSFSPTKAGEE